MILSQQPSQKLFWVSLLFFCTLYLIFYPPIYAFRDESDYLSMAYVFRQGTFWIEKTLIPVRSWISNHGHRISDYPPGTSLLLIPFTYLGWKSVFLMGLIFHFLGAVYFRKTLQLFEIKNPVLPLLYIFFPLSIFLSRTLMSDIPAAVLFLMGIYCYYCKPTDWKGGFFWGLSLWVRPTGIIFMLPFLIRAAADFRRRRFFLLIVTAFAALLGIYNKILYSSFWTNGYSGQFTGMENFSSRYFAVHFVFYLKALLISYPLMLLSPLAASKTRRPEILLAVLSGILFFSFYFYQDHFKNEILTLLFGTRFLLPAFFLLLLMYAEACERLLPKPILNFVMPVLLIAGCGIIQKEHQKALLVQESLCKTLYQKTQEGSILIYDDNSAELIQKVWGNRYYIAEMDPARPLEKVLMQADFSKGVFLAKRNEGPDKLNLSRIFPEKSDFLQNRFIIRRIANQGGLEIFQFHERHS